MPFGGGVVVSRWIAGMRAVAMGVVVWVAVGLAPGVTVTVGVGETTVAVGVIGVLVAAFTIGFVADQSRGTILKLLQCGDMWVSSSSRAR